MSKFDLDKELEVIPMSNMIRNGFLTHINLNNIKITSKKDLESKLEEFKEMKVGE